MELHHRPPMTLAQIAASWRWLLPSAGVVFVLLAIGALGGWLVWDEPITRAAVDARSPTRDDVFRRISMLGSTKVVIVVSAVAALLSIRRCPRLALAIVVIAVARPLAEFALKEGIRRDRPVGDRLVHGEGYSFPSGHPLAAAASWGTLPLVAALYLKRRWAWWAVVVFVWTLAVGVAASRVWLGVHWTSDVVAGLVLAVLGVAAAERFIDVTHGRRCGDPGAGSGDGLSGDGLEGDDVDPQVVDRPVLDAPT